MLMLQGIFRVLQFLSKVSTIFIKNIHKSYFQSITKFLQTVKNLGTCVNYQLEQNCFNSTLQIILPMGELKMFYKNEYVMILTQHINCQYRKWCNTFSGYPNSASEDYKTSFISQSLFQQAGFSSRERSAPLRVRPPPPSLVESFLLYFS